MGWLPMYLVADDAPALIGLLDRDPEVAFLESNGPGRWIARNERAERGDGCVGLWHIPSGPLPLLGVRGSDPVKPITDPWSGWTELTQGADPTTPYFGSGHPGVIWLNLQVAPRQRASICGMSSFEWIGNHYRPIGRPARPETERWWKQLRRVVGKIAQRVPRGNLGLSAYPELAVIYAFPGALRLLGAGRSADSS